MSKRSKIKAQREEQWYGLTSPAFERRDEDVILKIGATEITRAMFRGRKWDLHRSAQALSKAVANHPRYCRAKNAEHLASMVRKEDLLELPRVGEFAVTFFGLLLVDLGVNALKWWDGNMKIATCYAKVKGKKRKRAYRQPTSARVVPFRRSAVR